MGAQVVHNREDMLDLARNPVLDLAQEVGPVDGRPLWVRFRHCLAIMWRKRAENVAFTTSSIIDLLRHTEAPLIGGRCHNVRSLEGFGALWSHFIEADYDTVRRRLGVERDDGPL